MANGFYILHSRDPHLAAVGFVWGPLSSVADLPLLLFNGVWPALSSHDVSGTTMTAIAMAGAVYQLNCMLREWEVSVAPRVILTLFFAANPLIMLFGGNGMSEGWYVFLMLATTRYLTRWFRKGDLTSLVLAACTLGIAYLDRSEPVAVALVAAPFALCVTYVRSSGDRRARFWAGLTDATILVIPFWTCFVAWAVMSYVITGQAFLQFSSKYGNSYQIAAAHIPKGHLSTRLFHEFQSIEYLAPALPILIVVAVVVAIYRRNALLLPVAAVLGAGAGFTLVTYLMNTTFPWFRFYILWVPMSILVVGTFFSSPVRIRRYRAAVDSGSGAGAGLPHRTNRRAVTAAIFASIVSIALLAPSIPGTMRGMDNSGYSPDIVPYYGYIFHAHPNAQDLQAKAEYPEIAAMAKYISSQNFSDGDIVIDTGQDCVPNIVTNVRNPRVFVITNDRDFQRVLDDPLTFGAHYLIGASGSLTDSVTEQYPNLEKGVPWAEVVRTLPRSSYCPEFTLYKVIGHPQGP